MSEPTESETRGKTLRNLAYVVRCAGSTLAAYELAGLLGLQETVWAAMSALIVSQDRLHETQSSLMTRILGTLIGLVITIVVSEGARFVGAPMTVQMGLAVTIAAVIAREFPDLRVVMWTCPIVLLTAQPTGSILAAAFSRGSEVVLGAVVGWLFHWGAEIVVDALSTTGPVSAQSRQFVEAAKSPSRN